MLVRIVTSRFKLVALALMMTLLAMPMSALAHCWLHIATAKDCRPHCPMMGMQAPSTTVQAAPANTSCCQVSAAKPIPSSMPQSPSDSGARVAPTLSASALDVPTTVTKAEPPDPLARASGLSLQAAFCTFLI